MKAFILAAAVVALTACQESSSEGAQAQVPLAPSATQGETRKPDVIFVPTPRETVEAMLELAEVKKGDVVYDLGSGDGRIPITAARKYGVRAVGVDIDPARIAESNANARAAGVTELVTFRQEDLFKTNISEASVVTLYLLSSLNDRLRPKLLAELKPGTRVVSHAFPMSEWEPERTVKTAGGQIYLWRVPERTTAPR